MRNLQEILSNDRILCITRNINNDNVIQLMMTVLLRNKYATVKFTRAMNWEHLSVSFQDETPSWDDMQRMKEMFWTDDEECFQLHPKKENYINNHEHCLHIWRPTDGNFPIPPSIFVGFRQGKQEEDIEALKQMQIAIGEPLSDEKLKFLVLYANDKKKAEQQIKKMSLQDLLKLM